MSISGPPSLCHCQWFQWKGSGLQMYCFITAILTLGWIVRTLELPTAHPSQVSGSGSLGALYPEGLAPGSLAQAHSMLTCFQHMNCHVASATKWHLLLCDLTLGRICHAQKAGHWHLSTASVPPDCSHWEETQDSSF